MGGLTCGSCEQGCFRWREASAPTHATQVEALRRGLERDQATLAQNREEQRQGSQEHEQLATLRGMLAAQRELLLKAQVATQQQQDRDQAFERAFASSRFSAAPATVYGGVTLHDPTADAQDGLASLRGKVPFPIAGKADVQIVHRKASRGAGVELHVPVGAAVHAIYAGRVAFTTIYQDLGLLVILDHGGGYFSVYGDMGAVDVHVGDTVSAGAPIGTASEQGGRGQVYFELRQNQDTLDPHVWLGI